MKAEKVYSILRSDFILDRISDDWEDEIRPIRELVTDKYRKEYMGLVCDFTSKIEKVYTAVFPSDKVMKNILDRGTSNAMLFVHHPALWDVRREKAFEPMNKSLLKKFKDRNISVYNLHHPLDNRSEYSTSTTLAKKLSIEPIGGFAEYEGAICGIIGRNDFSNVEELKKEFESIIGHKASLYNYGSSELKGKIGIVAGGGNQKQILEELFELGMKSLVTGLTLKNEHSKEAHKYAKEKGINLFGGTHYSTEKFACKAMCDYFEKIGVESEFVPGEPVMEDL